MNDIINQSGDNLEMTTPSTNKVASFDVFICIIFILISSPILLFYLVVFSAEQNFTLRENLPGFIWMLGLALIITAGIFGLRIIHKKKNLPASPLYNKAFVILYWQLLLSIISILGFFPFMVGDPCFGGNTNACKSGTSWFTLIVIANMILPLISISYSRKFLKTGE